MLCVECGRDGLTQKDVGFNDGHGFIVCKTCNDEVNSQWAEMKTMLRAEGIDPDNCHVMKQIERGEYGKKQKGA